MPAVGPWIAQVAADESLQVVVKGTGLADRDGDRLLEHSTQKEDMWRVPKAEAAGGLVFDLGKTAELETIQIWNYNQPGYTAHGIAQADVSVWTQEDGWKTIVRQAKLNEAEGTDDYDEPTLLKLTPTPAQKVRLDNLKPFGDEGFVGLSAIRFYATATFAACNPQPPVGAALSHAGQISLAWTPGKEAVAHDIYAAPEGEALRLLGRIAQSQVELAGLLGGRPYRWRVDQVRRDGSITVGPEWSFALEPGRCVAHWTFDEGTGNVAHDTSASGPTLDAVAMLGQQEHPDPNVLWSADGKFGGCIDLTGGGRGDGPWFDTGKYAAQIGLEGSRPRSLSVWVYPRAMNDGAVWDVGRRVAYENWSLRTLNTDHQWRVQYWDAGDIDFNTMNDHAIPSKDVWVHLALTHDGRRTRAYVNGRLIVDEDRSRLNTGDQFSFRIGHYGPDGQKFNGLIDDMRIYNYALSDEQVEALAQGHEPGEFVSAEMPALALVGAELLDADADLEGVAVAPARDTQSDEVAPARRNLLPVLIIVAAIAAAAILLRKKSA